MNIKIKYKIFLLRISIWKKWIRMFFIVLKSIKNPFITFKFIYIFFNVTRDTFNLCTNFFVKTMPESNLNKWGKLWNVPDEGETYDEYRDKILRKIKLK